MTCAIKPIMHNPIPECSGFSFQQAAALHDLVAVLHNHWKQLLLCKENPHTPQWSLPVSARVWLRPQATETITCSARASINLGASRRLVSPWPSWPLSFRPKEAGTQAQCLITQTNTDNHWACYLPQLHSLPSVVMKRLWAAQGPDTTQLTWTSFRQP